MLFPTDLVRTAVQKVERVVSTQADRLRKFAVDTPGRMSLSVSIAQNVFMTVLLRKIPEDIAVQIIGGTSDTPILSGATKSVDWNGPEIPPDQLESTLRAFAYALDKTFIVPIVAGSLCVAFALVVRGYFFCCDFASDRFLMNCS